MKPDKLFNREVLEHDTVILTGYAKSYVEESFSAILRKDMMASKTAIRLLKECFSEMENNILLMAQANNVEEAVKKYLDQKTDSRQ